MKLNFNAFKIKCTFKTTITETTYQNSNVSENFIWANWHIICAFLHINYTRRSYVFSTRHLGTIYTQNKSSIMCTKFAKFTLGGTHLKIK